MASNINPNSIDNTYPIAGQDNDSQGFRDNFTNTKSNFEHSRDEIDDLQNNALLKNALSGSAESADAHNNLDVTMLTSAVMKDMRLPVSLLGNADGTTEIDVSTAYYFTLSTGVDIELVFINFINNFINKVMIEITVENNPIEVTLPRDAQNTIGPTGSSYYNAGNNSLELPTGVFIYEFFSTNGGSTLIIVPVVEEVSTP